MTTWDDAERAALVALLRTRPGGIKWVDLVLEVAEAGSALAVWDELSPATLFGNADAAPLETARTDIRDWTSSGMTFLTFMDDSYPAQLREIHQAPPFIFCRGEIRDDVQAVSVVGSRAASEQGLKIARHVAAALTEKDFTVISGLAAGIDTAAHTAALSGRGRTVAVIASGINEVYPKENAELQHRIAGEGLLISQFWPDARPQKHTFLMRNATMSGYGKATVVVEAGEKSGARAQARMAVEHGRPVILTDLVVDHNQWAKSLLERPGVYVAASTDEVLRLVDKVTCDAAEPPGPDWLVPAIR